MMKISYLLMIFFITFFIFSASATEIIDGDTVYINNDNVYLSAYPHTLSESGYVYFNLTSKHFSGDIDFCFGFDSFQCKPISAEVLIGSGWVDISERFDFINYDYDNLNTWYYLKEIPIFSNTNYTLRGYLEINEISTGGKYGVAVKPSSETIFQAIDRGHFYYLDPWWDGDYLYRKEIVLTGNTSGAQTDYQLLLNVTYDPDMQIDFDDLRFTNDTHQIDTWLENKTDGSYALIWVEFPTTPANTVEQTYHMYYGKADAVDYWDGDATFKFFDDFSGASFDSAKWQTTTLMLIGSGKAYTTSNNARLISTNAHGYQNYRLRNKASVNSAQGYTYSGMLDINEGTTYAEGVYIDIGTRINTANFTTRDALNNQDSGVSHDSNYHICEIVRDTSDVIASFDSVSHTWASGYPTSGGYILAGTDVDGGGLNIDWVFFAKYCSNPPTYAFGAEETSLRIPPNPINLQNTTGIFWINHIWQPGVGNITDSYNVSANNIWHNTTINTYWNVTYAFGNNVWQNITVWAYNNSGVGSISNNNISQNTQLYFTNFPTDLQKTYNHTWVNWTWDESYTGTHIIDNYNVSINDIWNNTTTNQYYNHTGLDYGDTSSIVVYGYNNTNGLSIYYVSGSYDIEKKLYKIVLAIQQLVKPLQTMVNKFINIIPFIIAIILFAGFGLAIMTATNKLKKW